MSHTFLSKAHVDLKTLVADDNRGTLEKLHVTPEYVEASNGHVLLRVPTAECGEFPLDEKTIGEELPATGTMLAPTVLEKAFKNANPKSESFSKVLVSTSETATVLQANDGDSGVTIKGRKEEGIYPDTEQVFPNDVPYAITLNAEQLKLIADWTCKNANNRSGHAPIRFYISAPDHPVYFEIVGSGWEDKKPYGLLMPFRDKDAPQIARLTPHEEKEAV